jgi:hypothetical protein
VRDRKRQIVPTYLRLTIYAIISSRIIYEEIFYVKT